MKIAITIIALASSASAFAPSITGVSTAAAVVSRPAQQAQAQAQAQAIVALQAGGDDEEEGFDLNLEEMFDMWVQFCPVLIAIQFNSLQFVIFQFQFQFQFQSEISHAWSAIWNTNTVMYSTCNLQVIKSHTSSFIHHSLISFLSINPLQFQIKITILIRSFDAADADENFDDAIKKVKGDEKKKK